MSLTPRAAPRSRWRRALPLIAPSLLVLVLVGAWLGIRVLQISSHLRAVRTDALRLQSQVENGQRADRGLLSHLQSEASAARGAANDPVLRLVARIPALGNSLTVVRGLTLGFDEVAQQALPPLANSADDINQSRSASLGAGVPLAPLARAATPLAEAAANLDHVVANVQALPNSWLVPPLGSTMRRARQQLQNLDGTVHPAADFAAIGPAVLGGHGIRRYFVAFLNPAEARASGGLFGAYAIVTASNGRLKTTEVGSDTDLPALDKAPDGLPADAYARYQDLGGLQVWATTGLSPDFPTNARTWAAMYQQVKHVKVDGVLSMDASGLAAALRHSAPIRLSGLPELTSRNVVTFIQRDEYALPLSPEQRKSVLKRIAHAASDDLLNSAGSVRGLAGDLAHAAGSKHLRAWSGVPGEESRIEAYPLAGLTSATGAGYAMVSLNNASSGKLDEYLHSKLTYQAKTCSSTSRTVGIQVNLTDRAPSGLPSYVTVRADAPDYAVHPGSIREYVTVYLARGARVLRSEVNGVSVQNPADIPENHPELSSVETGTELGRPYAATYVETPQGGTSELRLTVAEPVTDRLGTLEALPQALPLATAMVNGGRCP